MVLYVVFGRVDIFSAVPDFVRYIEYNIEYVVDLKGQKNPNPTQYTVEDEIIFIDLYKDGYAFEWDIKAIPMGTILYFINSQLTYRVSGSPSFHTRAACKLLE